MADTQTFDITTGCDLQEVDNAVNQANKELTQRYDFRNVTFSIAFKKEDNTLTLAAPDGYKLGALFDVLQQKLIKRQVPVQNLKAKDLEQAAGGTVRQVYDLQQGIETDVAKQIVKVIKEAKLKKVQGSILKDQVRVASPSRDELQQVMALLRNHDFGIALNFGNYR